MDFKNNKYKLWYDKLIELCRSRHKPLGYTETHHIIPRSLGGLDTKENLVVLTAREHYVAHLLLVKFVEGESAYHKMITAVLNFKRGQGLQKFEYERMKMNSHLYEALKIKRSAILSVTMSGEGNPFYGKKHSAKTRAILTAKNIGRVNTMKGKSFGDAFKEKARARQLGKKPSPENLEKRRQSANIAWSDPERKRLASERSKASWAKRKGINIVD